ncbi:hypothetical protein GCM10008026_03720 [Chelatococcus composti]|nr:hypothetical protein GCM10008026_03720 [Chelatococcus composti]
MAQPVAAATPRISVPTRMIALTAVMRAVLFLAKRMDMAHPRSVLKGDKGLTRAVAHMRPAAAAGTIEGCMRMISSAARRAASWIPPARPAA